MALKDFIIVPLEEINIKKRLRIESKEIEKLAESIKKYGLLNPIIISRDKTLIAGYRRFLAVKLLGMDYIEARIVDVKDEIMETELEIEENVQRSQFTEEELLIAMNKLNRLQRPNFFIRIWRKIVAFFVRNKS